MAGVRTVAGSGAVPEVLTPPLALSGPHHICICAVSTNCWNLVNFAVANLEYMADLRVQSLAGGLEGPRVAPFDDDRVAGIVELLRMDEEGAVKNLLRSSRTGSGRWLLVPPSLATRLVRIPLCLAPLDVGIHQTQEGGNISSTEAVVRISNQLDVAHCSASSGCSFGNPRGPFNSALADSILVSMKMVRMPTPRGP